MSNRQLELLNVAITMEPREEFSTKKKNQKSLCLCCLKHVNQNDKVAYLSRVISQYYNAMRKMLLKQTRKKHKDFKTKAFTIQTKNHGNTNIRVSSSPFLTLRKHNVYPALQLTNYVYT